MKENKGTRAFTETIKTYLDRRALADPLFAVKYSNPEKSIEDCITFILNEVKKSGCNGFADSEIYGMAVHYWEESEIEVGDPINCKVVVNHTVELTAEEKEEARKEAIRRLQEEEMAKMRKPTRKATETMNPKPEQASLFDF